MKKYIKYFIIFIFSLIILLFSYNIFFGDSIANFGFSYALVRGEIPYNDFNMILPLFSPLFYAIPLLIYNSSITFFITQAILITILFYLLETKLNNKIYLLSFIILFNFPIALVSGLFPGYNFIIFFLIILLSILDNKNINDYIIGFLIGLAIVTKHTVGIFLVIPSLIFYYKDYKKLLKRFVGLLIPCFIFLIYLLITKSFNNFFNLCILGIFDFADKNKANSNIFLFIVFGFIICYFIYLIIKNKRIDYYYLFLTSLLVIPLFDEYHLSYFIISFLIVFLDNIKFNNIYKYSLNILNILIIFIWSFITFNYDDYRFINYKNYPFRYMSNSMIDGYNYIDNFIKNTDKEVILFMLGTENYFYKITNDLYITYFDLSNYGNYGYNSYNNMKKRIDELDDCYYIINNYALNSYNKNQQYYKELANYIISKGNIVDTNKNYSIYYID